MDLSVANSSDPEYSIIQVIWTFVSSKFSTRRIRVNQKTWSPEIYKPQIRNQQTQKKLKDMVSTQKRTKILI